MNRRLKKNLTLFDVYAMSTGAMFSSGLFLLPGIAASYTGDSVYLAYLLAGFLILPAMYCMAELSTAMPKAGGTYYFLDRSMGPLMGTIGGLGSWIAVVFKSSFALVGMGAYLGLYLDIPFTFLAVILTVLFGIINIFGAKETTLLQRFLVAALVIILVMYIIVGIPQAQGFNAFFPNSNAKFFTSGLVGFISTIGLVFVSYAGLTKVASVAEEVENPDINIPLGMTLSLITATVVYTLGTMIMINVLPPEQLHNSLTPVADAGREFMGNLPFDLGMILIIVAAIAAFASTGNAGIMSASRYPFAMAKDNLIPESFSELGKYRTPTKSIVLTVVAMIAVLLVFNVEAVAKLASAFQLLLFGMISVAVIVMRESKITTYRPGFSAPFYPWLQICGVLISFWLIIEMGILAIVFTGLVVIFCIFWFQFYAFGNLKRRGAIFHIHQRLGKQKYEGLERELMTIVHDRTQSENLSYEALVARSAIVDFRSGDFDEKHLSATLQQTVKEHFHGESGSLCGAFKQDWQYSPIGEGVFLARANILGLRQPELIVYRFALRSKILVDSIAQAHTLLFLVLPLRPIGLDLRIAGHFAEVVQSECFANKWNKLTDIKKMKSVLMRDDHFYHGSVSNIPLLQKQIGKTVAEISLPASCIIALIERKGEVLVATPHVLLLENDEVAIIGEPADIQSLENN